MAINLENRLKKGEEVYNLLKEEGIYADVYPYHESIPVICVEIHWGDWKHEHIRAKFILEEHGYAFLKTEVTEENGSDCYSAIHYFCYLGGSYDS